MILLKDLFKDQDLKDKGWAAWMDAAANQQGDPAEAELKRAEAFVAAMKGVLKSTVVPKFIVFMAKKLRLDMFRMLAGRYVKDVYVAQSIAPVRGESAAPLSDEQVNSLKDKMKKTLGVQDIKLATNVNPALVAGFKLYWDFIDPEKMSVPMAEADYSFESQLKVAAVQAGVAVE